MPMPDSTPRIEPASQQDGSIARVLGRWTASQLAQPRLLPALRAGFPGQAAGWDLREAEQLDHVGAQWLWDQWQRRWPERIELLPAQRAVLERVAKFTV